MPKPLIAYYRVSTKEQGRSGLGLDARHEAVARFAAARCLMARASIWCSATR
jgi:DNA invertase Pin-like site-specific DNA recombinase